MIGGALHPLLHMMLRDADAGAALAAIPSPAEWQTIVEQAAAERLTVLLARWLRTPPAAGRVPAAIIDTLADRCAGLAARNLLLASELTAILKACEPGRIRCAPLRGLALAERLHGDIAVRPMGDIDLLVHEDDLSAIAGLLEDRGFRELDRRPGFARAFSYTHKFFKDRHGWIIVEPHWTIAYPPATQQIDMAGVWHGCRRGLVLGVPTWRLAAGPLLLHLCLHFAHRQPEAPYLWLAEIDRLIGREFGDMNWTEFVELTAPTGASAVVAELLSRVRADLGTPIPDGVLHQLARTAARPRQRRLARLLAPSSGVDGKESLALLFTLDGITAKLRYALALLFPTPDFMMVQYGLTRRAQLGPAYLRRVSRFSWEGMKGVVRLLV